MLKVMWIENVILLRWDANHDLCQSIAAFYNNPLTLMDFFAPVLAQLNSS